jgi:hypothetical protein
MQLDRSRTALRQAAKAVEELRTVKNEPEAFRDRFVSAMGMVQRVGSVIDDETKGHRTSEFDMWWKATQSDPVFAFMQDVRNAEFKRGEARQAAHHYVTLGGVVEPEGALSFQVIQGGKVIQEGSAEPSEPAARPSRVTPWATGRGALARSPAPSCSGTESGTGLSRRGDRGGHVPAHLQAPAVVSGRLGRVRVAHGPLHPHQVMARLQEVACEGAA